MVVDKKSLTNGLDWYVVTWIG